jgi:hypothetical protein
MRDRLRRVPSPALVVAALALVAALAGSALAGRTPEGQPDRLSKKERKQVNKLITKRASSSAATVGVTADIELTGEAQDIATTTINAKRGRVIAVASVELDGIAGGADDRGRCRLRIAGVDGPLYIQDVPPDGAGRSNVAITFARQLGRGSHAVAVRCDAASGELEVEEANLSVWGIAS